MVSLRGGDFLFECGQDIAIGYDSHDAENVALYFVESFSFRVATPEAAVALPLGQAAAQAPLAQGVLPRRPVGRVGCERVFEAGATTSSYLDALNPEQLAAATHPGGPLLVLAGAGTGKTTTLAARVAWLSTRARRPSACCC